jgi:hypothetical protein
MFRLCGKGRRLAFEVHPERFLDPSYVPST